MTSKPPGAYALGRFVRPSYETSMNISRNEQRAPHVPALGGHVLRKRGDGPKIASVTCVTREGTIPADFGLAVFRRLRQKRLIESRSGSPYRISKRGRIFVRAQDDNQGA